MKFDKILIWYIITTSLLSLLYVLSLTEHNMNVTQWSLSGYLWLTIWAVIIILFWLGIKQLMNINK